MPYADLGDIRIYFEEYGGGPPAVMLHGFTLNRRMWYPNLDVLQREFRLILPDARGHGLSDAPETGYSRDHRVEDLRRLVDNLKLETFHLLGLSMGGSTAIGYALQYRKRLRSLTLISTGAAGYSVSKKLSRLDDVVRREGIEAAKAKWMEWSLAWYRNHQPEIGNMLHTMMREHSGAVWKDPMRGKYPRSFDLEHVHGLTVPTLIMSGVLDKMFVPLARALASRMPKAKLKVYEDIGHMINLEIPSRFNEDLISFLRSVEKNVTS